MLIQFKDDVPPRYADAGARHSRARLDYELVPGASQYGDAYGDRFVVISFSFFISIIKIDMDSCRNSSFPIMIARLGRSNIGNGGSRGSISSQDSHGLYGSRQGMGYGGVFLVTDKLL